MTSGWARRLQRGTGTNIRELLRQQRRPRPSIVPTNDSRFGSLLAMIVNRQRSVPVSMAALERFCARARRSLRLAKDSMTVCLVTNAEITLWNRAYRGKNRPTDVLSFPAQADPPRKLARRRVASRRGRNRPAVDSGRSYIGDIAIAPAVARENALKFGRTLDDEMRILILHGMLHLLGYDHETDNGQMERRERTLRRALGLTSR